MIAAFSVLFDCASGTCFFLFSVSEVVMINKFKLARMQEGKKQMEVSIQTGIHYSVLSQLENGWRNPTPDQLRKLEKALPKLKNLAA